MSVPIEEILSLSVKKRLELIEEIWDSIVRKQLRMTGVPRSFPPGPPLP